MASMISTSTVTGRLGPCQAQIARSLPITPSYMKFTPFVTHKPTRSGGARQHSSIKAGLLDFLNPQAGAATSGRAEELVTQLLEVARTTNGGTKANDETQEQLEDLVALSINQNWIHRSLKRS